MIAQQQRKVRNYTLFNTLFRVAIIAPFFGEKNYETIQNMWIWNIS